MTVRVTGGGTLEIRHPPRWVPERRYVLGVLLEAWRGLEVRFVEQDRVDTEIAIRDRGRSVVIVEGLFSQAEDGRMSVADLPRGPFPERPIADATLRARLTADRLPVLAPADGEPVAVGADRVEIRFDLLGACFLFLSRIEEAIVPERDRYGRFPRTASMAWAAGLHQRPIVDEYAHVLWWALEAAGIAQGAPLRPGTILLTHDVDRPVAALEDGVRGLARRTAADVIVRRDVRLAADRIVAYPGARRGRFARDPNYSFDFLMDVAEAAGQAALFTILARTRDERGAEPPSSMDAAYRLRDAPIRRLLQRVMERGHRIGLHGSYNSYANPEQLRMEMDGLRGSLEEFGGGSEPLPARQHYLRWATPETARFLDRAGASFDSTLGYAEGPGFRCGTCRPFPLFDVGTRRVLSLWEHPLIVMDVALAPGSLSRGPIDPVLAEVDRVAAKCRTVGGEFVLLWHNNNAVGVRGRTLYREIVELADRGAS